jgi:hypothetical protein
VPSADRDEIKKHLVTLMLSTTNRVVQKQLSTALGVISETDFPEQWPTLLPVRVNCRGRQSLNLARTGNGCQTRDAGLRSDQRCFENVAFDYQEVSLPVRTWTRCHLRCRFRERFENEIASSIIYVVNGLTMPLLHLFKSTMALVKSSNEYVEHVMLWSSSCDVGKF